jgi:hypothetical protein
MIDAALAAAQRHQCPGGRRPPHSPLQACRGVLLLRIAWPAFVAARGRLTNWSAAAVAQRLRACPFRAELAAVEYWAEMCEDDVTGCA